MFEESRDGRSAEIKRVALTRAREKARTARWDLDVAVFLFIVLILVVILLFQDFGIEIVAPIAIFGLSMVWLIGWRRGQRLYQIFYDEEIARLTQERVLQQDQELKTLEATIEEKVQRALIERWR
jgi:hypothetical protein